MLGALATMVITGANTRVLVGGPSSHAKGLRAAEVSEHRRCMAGWKKPREFGLQGMKAAELQVGRTRIPPHVMHDGPNTNRNNPGLLNIKGKDQTDVRKSASSRLKKTACFHTFLHMLCHVNQSAK